MTPFPLPTEPIRVREWLTASPPAPDLAPLDALRARVADDPRLVGLIDQLRRAVEAPTASTSIARFLSLRNALAPPPRRPRGRPMDVDAARRRAIAVHVVELFVAAGDHAPGRIRVAVARVLGDVTARQIETAGWRIARDLRKTTRPDVAAYLDAKRGGVAVTNLAMAVAGELSR